MRSRERIIEFSTLMQFPILPCNLCGSQDGLHRQKIKKLLADLSADVVGSALCDHERLATLPLSSGLRYFRAEVDAHLERGECPAGVCRPVTLPAAAVSGRGKPTRRQARAQA